MSINTIPVPHVNLTLCLLQSVRDLANTSISVTDLLQSTSSFVSSSQAPESNMRLCEQHSQHSVRLSVAKSGFLHADSDLTPPQQSLPSCFYSQLLQLVCAVLPTSTKACSRASSTVSLTSVSTRARMAYLVIFPHSEPTFQRRYSSSTHGTAGAKKEEGYGAGTPLGQRVSIE